MRYRRALRGLTRRNRLELAAGLARQLGPLTVGLQGETSGADRGSRPGALSELRFAVGPMLQWRVWVPFYATLYLPYVWRQARDNEARLWMRELSAQLTLGWLFG
jgi:hypothetical protein